MQSPTSDGMLFFADRKIYAEPKLKGGGVPSPEGLQLNKAIPNLHQKSHFWALQLELKIIVFATLLRWVPFFRSMNLSKIELSPCDL